MTVIAVILAGGEGRRMGGADKAMLALSGQPLICHVTGRLLGQTGLRPQEIVISANGDPARFAFTGLEVLADETPLGPLAGILAALRLAKDRGAGAVISVPVDAPLLPDDLASRLSRALPLPAFARAGGRDHNATALWPVALGASLAAFLASGVKPKISDFAAAHGAQAVDFPDAAAFHNLNRPEDMVLAEELIRAKAPPGAQG